MGRSTRRPGRAVWLAVALVALLGFVGMIVALGDGPGLRADGAVKSSVGSADLDFHLMSIVGSEGVPIQVPGPSIGDPPAENGTATCEPGHKIAVVGALTGSHAGFAASVFDGAELAVTHYTKRNPGCQVSIARFDSGDNLGQVKVSAEQLVADPDVLAVVGPMFSHEVPTMAADVADSGLPFISPSATRPDLTQPGWPTFFRGVANDAVGARATGRYLAYAGFTKVCAVSLNYPDDTEVLSLVTAGLGTVADPDCSEALFANSEDFPRIVAAIKVAVPDAVYFVGDGARAADLLLRLRDAGVRAVFVCSEAVFDDEFLEEAGPEARGAIVATTFQVAQEPFLSAYRQSYGHRPRQFAVESYEVTTIVLAGMGSAGVTDRTSMTSFLRQYSGDGSANGKHYQWTASGDLVTPPVWLYQVW